MFNSQQLYQGLLLSDLEYALENRVEQDLWMVVFRQQISSLQSLGREKN
jgi:protein SMG7